VKDLFRKDLVKDFKTLLKLTVWSVGLLISLAFGMTSAYLVGSGVWFGTRFVNRLRTERLEG
jgi:hypothetical protein